MKRLITRFMFAWHYAYETHKWQSFTQHRQIADPMPSENIKHFDRTHFTAVTIGERKFLYCPVGNICSWSIGDHDHKYCHYCGKFFEEIARS